MEGVRQTPDQLLQMILDGDTEAQLKICTAAISASEAAAQCWQAAHVVEIDNLRRHIAELSEALLSAVKGEPVDPVLLRSAMTAMNVLAERY